MNIFSKKFLVPASILATLALVAGAYIFQPWKLFVDTEVQETNFSEALVLAEGSLISHEYETSGTVKILQLDDGSRVLRLENLDTTDGPRVEVWLTDSPVIEGPEGWRIFADGNYESLGLLKGNQGNQNYEIPDDLDLSDFSSISLWCVTFNVSFGAAELVSS